MKPIAAAASLVALLLVSGCAGRPYIPFATRAPTPNIGDSGYADGWVVVIYGDTATPSAGAVLVLYRLSTDDGATVYLNVGEQARLALFAASALQNPSGHVRVTGIWTDPPRIGHCGTLTVVSATKLVTPLPPSATPRSILDEIRVERCEEHAS